MGRILTIAWREFTATVLTKGFLFGLLIPPLIIAVAAPVAVLLMSQKPPAVKGQVAIYDPTPGQPIGRRLAQRLEPEALAAFLDERVGELKQAVGDAVEKQAGPKQGGLVKGLITRAAEQAKEDHPSITPVLLGDGASIADEKGKLLEGSNYDGSRLALIVIASDAASQPDEQRPFGTYEFFVKKKLDSRVQGLIASQARRAILDERLEAFGQSPKTIQRLTKFDTPEAKAITSEGEKTSNEATQLLVPVAFMVLLWISVFTGGQYLLTSTIEEKSNRVMEILLSAVSPMQLLSGKILGQMGAGLLILVLYSGVGLAGLLVVGMTYLVTPITMVLLVVFFFIAFFTIAAMMAAIGSAVNDIHEAQTLLTPVMLVVMTPMILMMPISWNPNSTFATVLSFVPPVNPFVMVLRMCSTSPPPPWQIALGVVAGLVGMVVMLRVASKIFRIGVLMYGKPPNLATLLRWARMA